MSALALELLEQEPQAVDLRPVLRRAAAGIILGPGEPLALESVGASLFFVAVCLPGQLPRIAVVEGQAAAFTSRDRAHALADLLRRDGTRAHVFHEGELDDAVHQAWRGAPVGVCRCCRKTGAEFDQGDSWAGVEEDICSACYEDAEAGS